MRIKATIAYNGSKFQGFQRQKRTDNTVSQTLEAALKSLGIESKITGSGRTDKGVHATGQVVHFDLPQFWQKKSLKELKTRLNQKLQFIQIKHIKEVSPNFHAQYDAKTRVYRYLIKTTTPSVFEKEFVSHYKIVNPALFQEALKLFEGTHNFQNFKKQGSSTSSDIRTVKKVKLLKIKNYYAVYFFANGYLRSQVRMMTEGALKVQNGTLALKQLKEQLNTKTKHFTTLAQPNGLYLARVFY